MKRFFTRTLFPLIILLCCGTVRAQVPYTIGNGTASNSSTTYPTPFGDWYEGSRNQFLFRASELSAAGMITGNISAVRWNVIATNAAGLHDALTIKIGNTSLSTLTTSGWETGLTTVFGPMDYTPVAGNNTFTFTTPFLWNGTSNIIVEICHGGVTSYTYNASVAYTVVAFNGSRSYAEDLAGSLCANANTSTSYNNQTYRPNTTFLAVALAPCDSPLNATVSGVTYQSASMAWTPPAGVTNFQYAVTTSATPPAAGTPISGATYNTGNTLSSGTNYFFHLRSACSAGQPFSNWVTRSFTTLLNNGCFPPSALTVSQLHPYGAVVIWPPVTGATSYDWELGLDPSPPAVSSFSSSGEALGKQGLTPNTTYFVHVRTRCDANRLSQAWTTINFTTPDGPPLTVGALAEGFLQVYPNPAGESLTLLSAKEPAAGARAVLKDVAGRTVAGREVTSKETRLMLQGIAPGLYFLHYSDAEGNAVMRIQKQ